MNILDRLLRQDAWATRRLLLRCRELPPEQLNSPIEEEKSSLRESLSHLVHNIELWIDLLHCQPVRPRPAPGEVAESVDGLIARLDGIAADGGVLLQRASGSNGHSSPTAIEPSLAGAIAQVISHNKRRRIVIHHFLIRYDLPKPVKPDFVSSPAALMSKA